MVQADTIEGVINEALWFHYDMERDVLYLRLAVARKEASYSEENADGVLISRSLKTDVVTGATIVNWWKRFGAKTQPNSIRDIEKRLENLEPVAELFAA